MGRKWTYGYTGSDLTSATDPMSDVTSYGYGAGATDNPLNANNITTVTEPNGQPGGPDAGAHTSIVYNSAGQVASQTDPMGNTTNYSWSGLDPATGTGTVADPDGNKYVYYYVQGTIAAQSDWTGATLTSEEDYVPDQTSSSGDNSAGTQLATATSDGDALITTASYDNKGNLIATTTPDGIGSQTATTTQHSTALDQPDCSSAAIASASCSTDPGPASVTPGGAITPPASAPPQGLTWTLYDNYGNQLYTTVGVYEPGSNTAAYSSTQYQLFNGNTLTLGSDHISCSASAPSASMPCATVDADGVVTQLAYNSSGDLVSSSTPDGNGSELATTTYGYDADGEQTSTISPDGNVAGANAANYTTVTAYNGDGEVTSVTEAGGSGATVTPRVIQDGYDADGNPTTVKDPRGYTTTTAYNADDEATLVTDPDGNASLTCYDGDGNAVQTVPPVGVAASSLTPASCPTSYPSAYGTRLASDATTYTYDADGNQTAITSPAPAGQTGYEATTYTYDGDGNVLTTTSPSATSSGPSQVTTDTYNSAGELATETLEDGTSPPSTTTYCYDPNGDATSVVMPEGNESGTATCESSSPWVISPSTYSTQAAYQTTSTYDSAGDLVSTTSPVTTAAPSGGTTTYTYDPVGNELTSTDPWRAYMPL
jgi:YD repeat-containing protein